MTGKYDNVIVFGPTGAVGAVVALEASKRGAKVWLAMRSTDKTIDGISAEVEQNGAFERVQADLTDPESVKAAVQKSGAKAAFVYLARSQSAHPRNSLEAMKSAGIEHVVFLSTYTIRPGEAYRDIPPESIIPYVHAQVEIALDDLDIHHTALRPGRFASNCFRQDLDKSKTPWEATPLFGDIKGDCITQLDIGRVGGAVLVEPPASRKEVIYLFGPQLLTDDEMWGKIKTVTGRDIVVTRVSPDEKAAIYKANGIPPPFVDYLVKAMASMREIDIYPEPFYSEAVGNVLKYSGYEPTKFDDYVASLNFD
jgi:uncharacterized protein YbjT (DUF2867 family)